MAYIRVWEMGIMWVFLISLFTCSIVVDSRGKCDRPRGGFEAKTGGSGRKSEKAMPHRTVCLCFLAEQRPWWQCSMSPSNPVSKCWMKNAFHRTAMCVPSFVWFRFFPARKSTISQHCTVVLTWLVWKFFCSGICHPPYFRSAPVVIEVMDEQTGSPGANTENNSQKNGDEVRAKPVDIELHIFPNFKKCLATVYDRRSLSEPSKHICFCHVCRSPDVAVGPRGGRGRSQWKTAMHPRPP